MPGPKISSDLLPGVKGKDYHYVRYGGKVYVVYSVKLPNGKNVQMSWRVEQSDYKALGVDPGKLNNISKNQFKALNFFGSASDIARKDSNVHPFQQYLKHLREVNGPVSWLGNKEFMSVMLMGWSENWSAEELRQRLTQTNWYQSRTDYQRSWELDMAPAQRKAEMKLWTERVTQSLENDILGVGFGIEDIGMSQKEFDEKIKKLASGKWGDPNAGMEILMQSLREKAENVEGTIAWITRQQQAQQQGAFMNAPEDMYEQIKQEAFQWLGPQGVPDDEVLKDWAGRLVSETASDADWQQYMQQQAKALYPWLGPNEMWQDRASSYKRIAEDQLGTTIGWDDGLLAGIGGVNDTTGEPTGMALSYDQFIQKVRSQDKWWGTSKAKEEGFNLFNFLNETFNGVSS